jgi:threonyl-tRNA synthetase
MTGQKSLSMQALRRSAAELLACALRELFPQTLLVKAGVSNVGFHYDFALEQPLDSQALILIEEHMRSIVREARPVRNLEMLRTNAIQFFTYHRQALKAEYLETLDDTSVELFQMGEFQDVCPSPHISNSREIAAFKLLSLTPITIVLPDGDVEGWRICGTACTDRAELKTFLKFLERSKDQDHRLLGPELDMFSTHPDLGPGLWMWHPKGTILRSQLVSWWKEEHQKQGFQFVETPTLAREKLFELFGLNNKIDFTLQLHGVDYLLAPTRAPAHALIFQRQYPQRELPLRYAELGETYHQRVEEEDSGLFNALNQWVDEAQIYCTQDQLLSELISSLQFIERTIKMFGFKSRVYLCSRRGNRKGNRKGQSSTISSMTAAQWKQCEQQLVKALEACNVDYLVDEESQSDYGWQASNLGFNFASRPRIEVRLIDALNREWSGPYVAVDATQEQKQQEPEQQETKQQERCQVIFRSLFGSLERFIALLVEQFTGVLPLWLAPEQVRIIPVTEKNIPYAEAIRSRLASYAIRTHVVHREKRQADLLKQDLIKQDLRSKIRCAHLEKVPYAVVVGDKEEEKGTLTVRPWNQDKLYTVVLEDFNKQLLDEISIKAAPV